MKTEINDNDDKYNKKHEDKLVLISKISAVISTIFVITYAILLFTIM